MPRVLPLEALSRLVLASGPLLVGAALGGCAEVPVDDGVDQQNGAVTSIEDTVVKRQYIGTCWLYATSSWAESLHLAATGEHVDLSESYWTYWTFYERIVAGDVDEHGWVSDSGTWGYAAELIFRYGMMREGDFIPEEANAEASDRTSDAYNAILTSLSVGALSTPAARKDHKLVRDELDAAFGLNPEVIGWLDATFGEDGKRVLGAGTRKPAEPILRARDFAVASTPKSNRASTTLDDFIGRDLPERNPNRRSGPLAWRQVLYPAETATPDARRQVVRRVQAALHDGIPVIVGWRVDHDAVQSSGALRAPSTNPTNVQAHLSLVTDYQASNVPGFGVLPVGVAESRPEALAAALSNDTVVDLFRIKNSWGRRPRQESAIPPGYHDIFKDYYDATLRVCNGAKCKSEQAFSYVILPPAY